ncbi:MAG: amidohydrolase [Planctomycetes bacterium]|nr:amidohydrolase [Planctomycetota bacterium]
MSSTKTEWRLIDAHQHLFYPERFTYAWTRGNAALNRAFRMDDYLAAAGGTGITAAVFMEADVDEAQMLAEAKFMTALAERHDNPLCALIPSCRPEKPGFRAYLEALAANPRVKGFRRILHTSPDELSQSASFAENVRALADYSYTFDLCVLARQLPAGIALVRRCPDVQFILDHCGVPDVKGQALDPWREHVRELARMPNAACKISGLIAYADPRQDLAAQIRPFVEFSIERFGWDRVLWGSDWPVCTLTSSLRGWVDAALALTRGASAGEQEKFFSANARRLYRL